MKRLALLSIVCAAAVTASAAPAAPAKPFKPKLDPPAASDYRTVDPQNLLVINTTKGRVLVEMIPEIAPLSVARIKELAHEHFYDGLTFHRVVPGFMAQGGDPNGTGAGGSSKPNLKAEFSDHSHQRGVCSMARISAPPMRPPAPNIAIVAAPVMMLTRSSR